MVSPFGSRRDGEAAAAARRERVTAIAEDVAATVPAAAREVAGRRAVLAGRYRIDEMIGQGGMATVHAGRDLLLDREVAVKVFRARATEAADLRLQEAEARNVASLNHYALTTLFDAGVDTGDPAGPQIYLVMERVHGSDLRTRLRQGALTQEQVAWLGFDLAEALDHVHRSGLLHRDIKPANVLLDDRASTRRFRGKLTDFGIAAMIGQPDDSEFTTGTAAYLSPEVVDGQDAVPASDVYALGLVLLEAVTGRVAFPGSITESAFARLDRDPEIPSTVPAPLAAVLRGMTERRPQDRLPLTEVAARLQAILVVDGDGLPDLVRIVTDNKSDARVAALRRYGVLDAPADDAFDAVTRLASRLLRVPIAVVSIVDVDRVWFKSRRGLQVEQVDRNVSFWSATGTGGDRAWTVPDALADLRTADDPLVVGEPHVRSSAAAPLITRDGHHLGALCVFDRVARIFTADDLADLTDLASTVQRELELRLASRRAVFQR